MATTMFFASTCEAIFWHCSVFTSGMFAAHVCCVNNTSQNMTVSQHATPQPLNMSFDHHFHCRCRKTNEFSFQSSCDMQLRFSRSCPQLCLWSEEMQKDLLLTQWCKPGLPAGSAGTPLPPSCSAPAPAVGSRTQRRSQTERWQRSPSSCSDPPGAGVSCHLRTKRWRSLHTPASPSQFCLLRMSSPLPNVYRRGPPPSPNYSLFLFCPPSLSSHHFYISSLPLPDPFCFPLSTILSSLF